MANPVTPIQRIQITKKDIEDPTLGTLNTQMQAMVNGINELNGSKGTTKLPGIDVDGATITGLGPPKNPTDAVSAAHAASTYSAESLGPQLDIGGKYALKGLTALWLNGRRFADAEVPNGAVDGTNAAFTLKNKPNPPLSLNLFVAGLRAVQDVGAGGDYTLSGAGITFATPPTAAVSLIACYRY